MLPNSHRKELGQTGRGGACSPCHMGHLQTFADPQDQTMCAGQGICRQDFWEPPAPTSRLPGALSVDPKATIWGIDQQLALGLPVTTSRCPVGRQAGAPALVEVDTLPQQRPLQAPPSIHHNLACPWFLVYTPCRTRISISSLRAHKCFEPPRENTALFYSKRQSDLPKITELK